MPQAAVLERRYAAIPDLDAGLSPRHFLASQPQLEGRQSNFECAPNHHRCQDTGFPNECCPDDQFCFVDKNFNSSCCAIGNNCASVNVCTDLGSFYCNTTITPTATTSNTRRASSSAPHSITSPPSTAKPSVVPACCPRPCDASSEFQCPSSLGGVCCSIGRTCVLNGCVATLPPSSSTTTSSIPSCATSNIPCTDGLGGCCHSDAHCTALESTGYCATGSAAPTDLRIGGQAGGGIIEKPSGGGGGLSTGAKAGIGAGVAILAILVIAVTVWWWMRRRKSGGSAPRGSARGSGPWGSARGGTETVVSMQQGSTPGGPDMAGRGTEDYFGPAAVAGPFTGAEGAGMARSGGVPVSPNQPGDIQPAVEIGDALGRPAPVVPQESNARREYWRGEAKTVNEHVELE